MGLDVSSVGNHEFDRGTEELRRISAATDGTYTDDVTACEGVTEGVDGCFGADGHEFEGAEFPYLAANVLDTATGRPMLPPYQIFTTPADQKIALIGVVTETTPTIVSPTGVEGRHVHRRGRRGQRVGADVAGEGRGGHRRAGARGRRRRQCHAEPAYDGCADLTGPIVEINSRISPAVDLIVSGHTHAYNCTLQDPTGAPRLVTQAGYYGRLVTDIRLSLDRGGRGTSTAPPPTGPPTSPSPAPRPTRRIQSIVDYWNARADETGNVVVGTVTGGPVTRSQRHHRRPQRRIRPGHLRRERTAGGGAGPGRARGPRGRVHEPGRAAHRHHRR